MFHFVSVKSGDSSEREASWTSVYATTKKEEKEMTELTWCLQYINQIKAEGFI